MSNTKEVANINGYRIKDSVAREKIDKPQLADFVDCDVFAQIIGEKVGFNMTGFGVQSIAIGGDILCVGISHGDEGTGSQSKLITYNINTGSVVAYADNLSIGHCNGMTYCNKDGYFYIACGGGHNGLNKIEVYDSLLTHIKTINFATYEYDNPFGIEWHEKTQSFYCCLTGDVIGKFDYNFNPVDYYHMAKTTDSDITYQTIFATDDYLFMIYNNLANKRGNYNKMDVYHINTMKLYKKQYVMHGLELEDCAMYNGNVYMLFNSQNSGLICKGSLYNDEYTGNFIAKYLFGGSKISTSSTSDDYYIDSTYKEFFVDNTAERPYNRLLVAIGSAIRSTYKERLSFYLKGDFSDKPINIKHLPCALNIEGYGDVKPKIGGMFLQNIGLTTLRNFEVVTRSPVENKLIALKSVGYAWLDEIDFNGTGTEQDALWLLSSTAQVLNSKFNSDVTRNLVHCAENSYIIMTSTNTFSGEGGIFIPEIGKIPSSIAYERSTINDNDVTVIPETQNFDITKITRSGKYYLSGGSTSINCPEGLKSGGYVFTVNHINSVVVYDVEQYSTNKYRGVYSINEGRIKWYGEFYVNAGVDFVSTVVSGSNINIATNDLKFAHIFGVVQFTQSISSGASVGTVKAGNYIIGRNINYYFHGIGKDTGKGYVFRINNNNIVAMSNITSTEIIYVDGVYAMDDIVFTV